MYVCVCVCATKRTYGSRARVALSGSVCPTPIRFGRPLRTPSLTRGPNELYATHSCLRGRTRGSRRVARGETSGLTSLVVAGRIRVLRGK